MKTSLTYLYSINRYIGKYFSFSPEELAEIDRLETQWKTSLKEYTFRQLIEIFPDAAEDILEMYKQDIIKANELEIHYQNKLADVLLRHRWFWQWAWNLLYIEPLREDKEEKIRILSDSLREDKETDILNINDQDILKAKDRPLTDFIKFNRQGYASCIWHNDKVPSMYYYKKSNRVYCFSCNQYGDTINIIQKLYNVNFKDAVKFLIK